MAASVPTDDDLMEKRAKMRELIREHQEKGWDAAWQSDIMPWDAGQSQPPLREVIESKLLNHLPTSGKALVPGCGRGYDAIYIANSLGLEALGTDISDAAIQAAQEYLQSIGGNPKVHFRVADFFTLDAPHGYDLIYDYTFFVAIPPAKRPDWGKQMCELIKPGGFLITLVFPIAPYTDGGPPFYVRSEHYDEVLGEGWEKVLDKVPDVSSESHVGKDRITVWRRL